MSIALISVSIVVLVVGATLVGLILTSSRGLRQGMARLKQTREAWAQEANRALERAGRNCFARVRSICLCTAHYA